MMSTRLFATLVFALVVSACGEVDPAAGNGTGSGSGSGSGTGSGSDSPTQEACAAACAAPGACETLSCDDAAPDRCVYTPRADRATCDGGNGFCANNECTPCSLAEGCSTEAAWPAVDRSLYNMHGDTDYWGCGGAVCGQSWATRNTGDHTNLFMAPGQVFAIEIPATPRGMFQTSKVIYSASGAKIHISKVPGRMDPDDPTMVGRGPCSAYTFQYDMTLSWEATNAPAPGSTPTRCWIPADDGPWYANVQLDYTVFDEFGPNGCTQFGNPCAMNILWYP